MHATPYEQSLRAVLSDFSLLDSGWRPGKAELSQARVLEQVKILPPKRGAPFCMIGAHSTVPAGYRFIVTSVFAVDLVERWARLLGEWVVIGGGSPDAAIINVGKIRRSGKAWLCAELQRLQISVRHQNVSAGYSFVGTELGEQLVEFSSTCH